MKRIYLLATLLTLVFQSQGQSILGQWETYDDKTNEKKAIIEIDASTDGDAGGFVRLIASKYVPHVGGNKLC